MTFIAHISREDLVGCLPDGGVAAEIGVLAGEFSQVMLDQGKASKAHLIDPWVFQDREDYLKDGTNSDQVIQNARYDYVLNRFARQISSGQVVIHKGFSEDVIPQFPDEYFDWVYIDAMHTREAVLRDLRMIWPKMKRDGFVLGHDFTNNIVASNQGFGVVEAVNEFVATSDALFLAMTMEVFPSYVLGNGMVGELCNLSISFCNVQRLLWN